MSKFEKKVAKMRNNPQGWGIDDLRPVFERYGFVEGPANPGSHVSFSHPKLEKINTIPIHKPIKSVYVKQLIDQIDYLEENKLCVI